MPEDWSEEKGGKEEKDMIGEKGRNNDLVFSNDNMHTILAISSSVGRVETNEDE
jgi:hypothetical protein